jgi:hypothetical protein
MTSGTPDKGSDERTVAADQSQPPRPLGDEHAPVGEELEPPGMLEGRARKSVTRALSRSGFGVGERGAS